MIKEISKTTYRVHIHFSTTSTETMSDKIKRMMKNEVRNM
ncbi:MAG: transposon-encoded TnpW family protein [Oscillospiraceae bacterium]|nr:transposon-encoded TnpW family protein [Oscillospiraceae bacterium]